VARTTTDGRTTARTGPGDPPVGFARHTGPAGLVTVLPSSFTVSEGANAGTAVAKDQRDPEVEVRFGGAAPEGYGGLFETIAEAARGTAAARPGYRQLALARTGHGGRDAVDWEFEYETPQGEPRRSRSHYWRSGGIEYVLLAQAPPQRWAEASRLLDTMIDHCYTP
ncbi:MAG: hypothetical protein HOV94_38210, partial [Saccharothrix sp.]|nr:hypothetical protein [Saccharothrix sp.]